MIKHNILVENINFFIRFYCYLNDELNQLLTKLNFRNNETADVKKF